MIHDGLQTSQEILTLREMEALYPDEWLLIGDPELDESLAVVRGTLLCHSKHRQEVSQAAINLPGPKRIATLYTGTLFDDDVEYLL